MKKHVVKFGEKYVTEYKRIGETDVISLTNNFFRSLEVDRKDYKTLERFIDLGADIKEVTFFESSENWTIKDELKEMKEAEE